MRGYFNRLRNASRQLNAPIEQKAEWWQDPSNFPGEVNGSTRKNFRQCLRYKEVAGGEFAVRGEIYAKHL